MFSPCFLFPSGWHVCSAIAVWVFVTLFSLSSLIMYAVGFVIVIFQKVRNRFAAKRCSSSFVCLFIFPVTCVAYVSFTVGKLEKNGLDVFTSVFFCAAILLKVSHRLVRHSDGIKKEPGARLIMHTIFIIWMCLHLAVKENNNKRAFMFVHGSLFRIECCAENNFAHQMSGSFEPDYLVPNKIKIMKN